MAAAALAVGFGGYLVESEFWTGALIELSGVLLGLGIAVLVVDYYLTSSEKQVAAEPLLKLVEPNVTKLHNELFVQYGRQRFGKDKFESLIDLYQKHDANPEAFAPDQLDEIYEALFEKKDELNRVYEALQEQLRELTLLLGWRFDADITHAALAARLNYATFLGLNWDGTRPTKLAAVEAWFDAEGATSVVVHGLIKHLGLEEEEWLKESL